MKKAAASLAGSRMVAELLPTSNQEDGVTSIGVGPGKKYEIEYKFTRNRRSKGMSPIMKIKEDTREGKLLEPIGVGATGVAEVRAVVIAMLITALGSSRMFVAAKNDMQSNQRVVSGIDKKKRKRRISKNKRHIPIASVSYSLPSSSSSDSETVVFMTSSSSESSRTSLNPSSEDKSTSGPRVAELGMDERMTTKEKPSFTAVNTRFCTHNLILEDD